MFLLPVFWSSLSGTSGSYILLQNWSFCHYEITFYNSLGILSSEICFGTSLATLFSFWLLLTWYILSILLLWTYLRLHNLSVCLGGKHRAVSSNWIILPFNWGVFIPFTFNGIVDMTRLSSVLFPFIFICLVCTPSLFFCLLLRIFLWFHFLSSVSSWAMIWQF